MVELRGGIGGFGGITTMNQDQRIGRYAPHGAVYKHTDHMTGITTVQCYLCHQEWTYRGYDGGVSTPPVCKRGA